MFNRSKSLILWLLGLPTVLIFYLSLFVVLRLWYPAGLDDARLRLHIIHFSIVYCLWAVVFFMLNVFEPNSLRRVGTMLINLASAMLVNLLVATAYFYFQPNLIITPRRFLLSHVALTLGALVAWYLFIQYIFRQYFQEDLYLLFRHEQDPSAVAAQAELAVYPALGFRLRGALLPSADGRYEFLGSGAIVIPDPAELSPEQTAAIYALRRRAAKFYSYRQVHEILHRKVHLPGLNELWFLENINYRPSRVYASIKRLIDVAVGLLGLLATAIFYPFVALAIKLDSPGPVLFHNPRVGQYGRVFSLHKFRSMTVSDNPGTSWTGVRDARITRVGRVLRRLRLDELPQSWNLLAGEMSLVGPRPEQPGIAQQLRAEIPFYDERHTVKPGLTGWGQLNVYARTVEQSKAKLQYDLYYIKHRSLALDLEIILKTLYHVITSSEV